jgi:ferritin-like metal-binding protein YciE
MATMTVVAGSENQNHVEHVELALYYQLAKITAQAGTSPTANIATGRVQRRS